MTDNFTPAAFTKSAENAIGYIWYPPIVAEQAAEIARLQHQVTRLATENKYLFIEWRRSARADIRYEEYCKLRGVGL